MTVSVVAELREAGKNRTSAALRDTTQFANVAASVWDELLDVAEAAEALDREIELDDATGGGDIYHYARKLSDALKALAG